ncbi:MAG: class I SAM-dependent methyltransferase, partial [Actinomycetota bacterium]|nr:class I SAM-dependent methyltransferase [Actinomycetota bacterium]
ERVLELAAGAGDVGLRAAEAVGPQGRVLCTDFAAPMVDLVRERADAAGLHQVEARVMDALEPDAGEESFDAILCRLGFMLMPDPAKAVGAARGLLAPEGRLVLAVWASGEENPWLSAVFEATMSTLGAPPPEPGTPGPFALADRDRLRSLLEDAGFTDVRVEDVDGERTYDSPAAWWQDMTEGEGPMSALMKHLQPEQLEAIRERASGRAEAFVREGGDVRFPARLVCARAA